MAMLALGCNSLTGFSSLDKADCVGGACGQGGAGGTGTGTGPGSGGAFPFGSIFTLNAGRHGTCLTLESNIGYCWGKHTGNAAAPFSTTPQPIDGPKMPLVGQGFDHHCGLGEDGSFYCWGGNDRGQLGDGTRVTRMTPQKVEGLPEIERYSLAGDHTCVVTPFGTEDPRVFCWGGNAYGELGVGDQIDRDTPVELMGLGDVIRVSCGDGYTCAVRGSDGALICWGRNEHGQLGLDPVTDPVVLTPTVIPGMPALERVYTSVDHTCGRTDGVKELTCWGRNDHGQLGDGTTTSRHTPQIVPEISNLNVAYLGTRHTCAADGILDVLCWGANDHGQLGATPSDTPVVVPQLLASNVSVIACKAAEHTCWGFGQELLCAGLNDSGQLGTGDYEPSDTPVMVSF